LPMLSGVGYLKSDQVGSWFFLGSGIKTPAATGRDIRLTLGPNSDGFPSR